MQNHVTEISVEVSDVALWSEALRQEGRRQLAEELRDFLHDETRRCFGPATEQVVGLEKVRTWLNENVPEVGK